LIDNIDDEVVMTTKVEIRSSIGGQNPEIFKNYDLGHPFRSDINSSIHLIGPPRDITQRFEDQDARRISYEEFKQDLPMHNRDILSERSNRIQHEIDKFDTLFEDIIVEDPYANSTDPINDREFTTHNLISFVTQFDGHGNKEREAGV